MKKRKTGQFAGSLITQWLHADDGHPDRGMLLMSDLHYIDTGGVKWSARTGQIINGASIPRFLWAFIGPPFTGDYRRASVVHDVACDTRNRPHVDVHQMFCEAMAAAGVPGWKRHLMCAAVKIFGPRW